jgi:hypothetical protein
VSPALEYKIEGSRQKSGVSLGFQQEEKSYNKGGGRGWRELVLPFGLVSVLFLVTTSLLTKWK